MSRDSTKVAVRLSPVRSLLLLTGAAALMVSAMGLAAWQQNERERQRSETRVGQALGAIATAFGATVRDYAVWDEAYDNLVDRLDEAWMAKNVGAWLYKNNGVRRVLLVTPDDAVAYEARDGEAAAAEALPDAPALRALIAKARSQAATDAPEATGLVELDGRGALAAVAAVRPEDAGRIPAAVAVLVLVRDLEGDVLDKAAQTVGLDSLALRPAHAGEAAQAVADATGQALGALAWTPERPGSEFLRLALPVSGFAFAIISVLALALWRRLDRAFQTVMRARDTVAASERRHRAFLESSPDHWLRLGRDGRVLDYVGPREGAWPVEVGKPVYSLLPDVADSIGEALAIAINGGRPHRFELMMATANGAQCYDAGVVGVSAGEAIFSARDITARKLAEDCLVFQAQRDVLTGLPNRALAVERLHEALAAAAQDGRAIGLVLVDVDDFKAVNDIFGHPAGDRVLTELSLRLQEAVGIAETVARLSGDEFLVLVPEAAEESLRGLADAVLATLARPLRVDGHEVFLSASAGLALYPAHGEDSYQLIKNADTALHEAKRCGKRAAVMFEPAMNESARLRLDIETRLRHAPAANELRLHYQPQLDVATGAVVGAEALIRWNSAELGTVPPAQFIPVAESTGMIVEIGRWVLETACAEAARWRDQLGLPLRMALNLSPRQFKTGDIAEQVAAALARSGLPAELLELEITEGLVLDEVHSAALHQLAAMGVRLALDDFGTGYSSLNYLSRFPFHALKIDRSFVSEVTTNRENATLTRTIIAMAHGLGLEVVGEGVETAEQMSFLAHHGAEYAQGYAIGRAMPSEKFVKRMLQGGFRLPMPLPAVAE